MWQSRCTKTWRGLAAAIALPLLLFSAGDLCVFDRNGDGVDDDGLDLSLETSVEIPPPVFSQVILIGWSLPHIPLVRSVPSTPRSPPDSRPAA